MESTNEKIDDVISASFGGAAGVGTTVWATTAAAAPGTAGASAVTSGLAAAGAMVGGGMVAGVVVVAALGAFGGGVTYCVVKRLIVRGRQLSRVVEKALND